MASIQRRGDSWLVRVRRKGYAGNIALRACLALTVCRYPNGQTELRLCISVSLITP